MRIKVFLLGLMISFSLLSQIKASGNISNAQALFIYNFLRHINWPDGSDQETFVIGVYGDSPVYQQLQQFTVNRKIGTKTIVLRRISSASDASFCQMVFVPEQNSSKISGLKKQIGNKSCLIVGEQEGSNAIGSTIEFLIQDNKLKFRIDEERAKQQNLTFSRALIDMAV
jgi:hypothetical protein